MNATSRTASVTDYVSLGDGATASSAPRAPRQPVGAHHAPILHSGGRPTKSVQHDGINMRVCWTTAVVTLRRSLAGHMGSTDISGQYKALAVWVRRDGRRQLVAESLNRLDRR